jgi:small-conductance mechanosensitive channel
MSSFTSIATFLGLASAGMAIALHDTIANLAGWVFIVSRTPFKVGNRIQIGETSGDVIDIRLFQFSVIEMGNWVQADQSTGRIVHIPNSRVLREPLANYETGFDYIWHEIPVTVTFESNWEKAKEILNEISKTKTEHLSNDAQAQIKRAAMKYLIYFRYLTPIVYTTVLDNGISLTIRYIIKPRKRRSSEQDIWEAILKEFAKHDDISLAYPTTRFYTAADMAKPL